MLDLYLNARGSAAAASREAGRAAFEIVVVAACRHSEAVALLP
jgi:hypothetical protein